MNDLATGALRRRRCYLVRHGHVNYFDDAGKPLDPRSVPLSAKGLVQAQALGNVLCDVPLDRALCSDYPRARQTLDQLITGRTLAVEELSGLREIRAGRLRDIPAHLLHSEVTGAYQRAAWEGGSFLRGEGWATFQARILSQFNLLLADPDWRSALVVSHDAVNRILLAWATGAGLQGVAALEQDHACLNVLDIDMDGPRVVRALVRTQNFTPYDPAKVGIGHTVMEHLYSTIDPRELHA